MSANVNIGDWWRHLLAWHDRLTRAIPGRGQHATTMLSAFDEWLHVMSGQPPTDGGSDSTDDAVDAGNERRGGETKTRPAWTPMEVERLFGSSERVRFLYVIAGHPDRQLTADEICDLGELEPSTFTQHRDVLLEFEIIERVETAGDEPTYRLNRSHPVARGFGVHR